MSQPPHLVRRARPDRSPEPARHAPRDRHEIVTRALWGGLIFAVILTIGVRIFVSREDARWAHTLATAAQGVSGGNALASATDRSDADVIWTQSPGGPATANALRLAWEDVPGAAEFRLRIVTLAGDVIVDGLSVQETAWTPQIDLLPALHPGEYVWQVEAFDQHGEMIARSAPEPLRIGP